MAGLAFVTGRRPATSPINAVAVSLHQMRWWADRRAVSAAALTALFVVVAHWPWHRHVVVGVTAAVALVALDLPTHRPSPASTRSPSGWRRAST